MNKLKDIVKGNFCHFKFYRSGQLWYEVSWNDNGIQPMPGTTYEYQHTLVFPIPIDDTGSGTFEPMMKALHLMRWIRKAIANE